MLKQNGYARLLGLCGSAAILVAVVLTGAASARAAAPQFDNGTQISVDKPYENTQVITDIYTDKSVYGKLQGATPIDIYSFTSDQDGERMISILADKKEVSDKGAPVLILLDPTNATEAQELGLPTPDDTYHTALITAPEDKEMTYNEPVLMRSFSVMGQQTVKLQKDKKYYLVVLDPGRVATHYVIRFGEGKSWAAKDFFTSFGGWIRLRTDTYAGTSPFAFPSRTVGMLLLILGLAALAGTWILSSILSFVSNRAKSAGYLLVKMQPYSRIVIWVSLWFMAIGGYIYLSQVGIWTGLPFVLMVLFAIMLVDLLVSTLVLTPQIMRIEVSRKEAALPLPLRRKMFAEFVVGLLSIGAFVTLLSMYLVGPVA